MVTMKGLSLSGLLAQRSLTPGLTVPEVDLAGLWVDQVPLTRRGSPALLSLYREETG